MARPLRIEFPNAVYHITARGNRREPIFVDDRDRHKLLDIVGQAFSRFDALMLAYCLMGNHYHFVLQTRQANLSRLMRHINGVYAQTLNHRHGEVGHLFQGRFKAILVDRDAYLLEVCRYAELNPVRARIVRKPQSWAWSSCRAHVGLEDSPAWLDSDGLYGQLLGRPVRDAKDRRRAAKKYLTLLYRAPRTSLWDSALNQQIFLGDQAFIERMQQLVLPKRAVSGEVPKVQRSKVRSFAQWLNSTGSREEALFKAYMESGLSMTALANELGLSVSRVSRLIAGEEQAKNKI
jgi:REP element-mobilizing transposase RayT